MGSGVATVASSIVLFLHEARSSALCATPFATLVDMLQSSHTDTPCTVYMGCVAREQCSWPASEHVFVLVVQRATAWRRRHCASRHALVAVLSTPCFSVCGMFLLFSICGAVKSLFFCVLRHK